MAWAPPQKVGDRDPSVAAAKLKLRKYSYGKTLDTTDLYTAEFGVALQQFQGIVHSEVGAGKRKTPDVNTTGVLDWATKVQLGLITTNPAAPAAAKTRHPAYVFRGTGGVIGQDYVSRVCQANADLVEEIHTPWAATMGGIPVGTSGGINDPSMGRAVTEGFTAWQADFRRRLAANPKVKCVVGGYSAGAVLAAKVREYLLTYYPDNYLCSFSIGDPTRPPGGSFYGGTDPGGQGIASWHYGNIRDWRHCWLTNTADPNRPDMYARIPLGKTGEIMQDAYDMVTRLELSNLVVTAQSVVAAIPEITADAGIAVPDALGALANGVPGLIGWGLPLLTGALGGLIGGGNPDTLTGTAAAAAAARIALTFALDTPPTRPHITYEFAEVWPGQTYLGLAIQHVRDYATRIPAVAA